MQSRSATARPYGGSQFVFTFAVLALMPGGCALERLDATRLRADAGASNAGASNAGASNAGASNAWAGTSPSAAGASATANSAGSTAAGRGGDAQAGHSNAQANAGGAAPLVGVAGHAGNTATGGVVTFAGSSAVASGGNAMGANSGSSGTIGAPTGGTSTGGSSATTAGNGAAGNGAAGNGAAGNGAAGNGSVPPLHVRAEALGSGRFRMVYDFADAGQLLDWEVAPASNTEPLTLSAGELVVNYGDFSTGGGLALARFRWPLQVTKLTVKSRNVTSKTAGYEHTNFYLATVWLGSWAPTTGYGCIFTGNRFFSMPEDMNAGAVDSTFSNNRNEPFLHEIVLSASELKWTTKPADVADPRPPKTLTSLATSFYLGSMRYLLVGGYESSNRFDDIVIEGTFGQF